MFITTFLVKYDYQNELQLRFIINKYQNDEVDEIGMVDCVVHEIMCSPSLQITKDIINKKKGVEGQLIITGSEYDVNCEKTYLNFIIKDLNIKEHIYV